MYFKIVLEKLKAIDTETRSNAQCTFMIDKSSIGPSVILFVTAPRAFLMEIFIAASISLEHSWAVELAAATTAATVPNFAEPFPLKEFTASL